jgi:F-type H+-transporting ATPase subunit b
MELLNSLGINWQLLLAQIVNFGILLFVLTRYVYRPVLAAIDKRRESAKQAAEELENANRKARDAEAERIKLLRKADAEAGEIVENGKKQAEKLQADILAKAKHEAEQIIARGTQLIAEERVRALADVQDTVAKVVVQLTETLLRREFGADDQKKMLKDLSSKVPSLMA